MLAKKTNLFLHNPRVQDVLTELRIALPVNRMTLRSTRVITLTVLVLLVVAPYLSPVLGSYAFFDDYMNLDGALRPAGLLDSFAAQGRPLMGLLLEAGFRFCGDIDGVFWLRLLTLSGLLAFACTSQWLLLRMGWTLATATSAAILLALLPSAQVVVSWATLSVCPFLALLSIGAFTLADRASRPEMTLLARVLLGSSAALFLFPAGLTYQHFVVFHCCFILAWALRQQNLDAKSWRRSLFVHGIVLAAGVLFAALALKTSIALSSEPTDIRVATVAVADLGAKLWWFLLEPCRNALAPFWLVGEPSVWALLQIVTIGMIVTAALIRVARDSGWRSVITTLLLITVLSVVSYSPNLVVRQNWASYRSLYPLAACIVIVGIWASNELVGAGSRARWIHGGILAALCVCASVLGGVRAVEYFSEPQTKELQLCRRLMQELELVDGTHCYLQMAKWQDSCAPRVVYDEFGNPSSAQRDSATGMFWLVLRELSASRGIAVPKITLTVGRSAPKDDSTIQVLDMRQIRSLRK